MTTLYKNDAALLLNDEEWQCVLKKYTLLQAAGGIVYNNCGELLMICKRGKWDLPKGTLEPNETLEDCALREVEEECGVSGLRLLSFRQTTCHAYFEDGVEYLKKTHWFLMFCDNCRMPHPQTEEDISQAVWASPQQVTHNLRSAHASIRDLLAADVEK